MNAPVLNPVLSNAIAEQLNMSTHGRFVDPIEFVEEELHEPSMQSDIATSLVWSLDTEIVNTARNLFYQMRKDNPDIGSDVETIVRACRGTTQLDVYWGEGTGLTLCQLLSIQPEWHATAERAAARTGWLSYRPKSLDELYLVPPSVELNGVAMVNIEQMALLGVEMTKQYGDHALKFEEERDRIIRTAQEQQAELSKRRRETLPAMHVIVQEARRSLQLDLNEASIKFHELPARVKLAIINRVTKAMQSPKRRLRLNTEPSTYVLGMVDRSKFLHTFSQVIAKLADEVTSEDHFA